MPHFLKNGDLEIHIDLPHERYQRSRFDWTGKITQVLFQGIPLTTVETPGKDHAPHHGQGFYNEFGMDSLPGFEEAAIGEWCHKIGIGLLKKQSDRYVFHEDHEIKPAAFEFKTQSDSCWMQCSSEQANGYAYLLQKEITLLENGFVIEYLLRNTGAKPFSTSEYTHNFLSINSINIGEAYQLIFPFTIQPSLFGETVNPESAVNVGIQDVTFPKTPTQQFFFSNLSGGEKVPAQWELRHAAHQISIRETASFRTNKINLWGWQHVISPELFIDIHLNPREEKSWSRKYEVRELSQEK